MWAIDNYRKPLLLLFMITAWLFMPSCYDVYEEAEVEKPENLINIDSMVVILADVEVTESALRQKQNMGHEITDLEEQYYQSVFRKHQVTRGQFDSSLAYYKQDMAVMNKIYEDVITRLSLMESKIQAE